MNDHSPPLSRLQASCSPVSTHLSDCYLDSKNPPAPRGLKSIDPTPFIIFHTPQVMLSLLLNLNSFIYHVISLLGVLLICSSFSRFVGLTWETWLNSAMYPSSLRPCSLMWLEKTLSQAEWFHFNFVIARLQWAFSAARLSSCISLVGSFTPLLSSLADTSHSLPFPRIFNTSSSILAFS